MPLTLLIILALVQGVTEFLPISSSGHLVLIHELGWPGVERDENRELLIDVAVHVGTLLSVLLYFHKDLFAMIMGVLRLMFGRLDDQGTKLALLVILGSLPVIAAGFALHLWDPTWLRSLEIMAWATIIFGALLWGVDVKAPNEKSLDALNWRDALVIGFAQILALIPGTSRSGITMTAARVLGYSRTQAARYSLLLAMVAISGAGVLGAKDVLESGDFIFVIDVLIAAALSFVSALVAIAVMMQWLTRATFAPFAIYRIVLGVILLALLYSGVLVIPEL